MQDADANADIELTNYPWQKVESVGYQLSRWTATKSLKDNNIVQEFQLSESRSATIGAQKMVEWHGIVAAIRMNLFAPLW